jgi:hypothetical protein
VSESRVRTTAHAHARAVLTPGSASARSWFWYWRQVRTRTNPAHAVRPAETTVCSLRAARRRIRLVALAGGAVHPLLLTLESQTASRAPLSPISIPSPPRSWPCRSRSRWEFANKMRSRRSSCAQSRTPTLSILACLPTVRALRSGFIGAQWPSVFWSRACSSIERPLARPRVPLARASPACLEQVHLDPEGVRRREEPLLPDRPASVRTVPRRAGQLRPHRLLPRPARAQAALSGSVGERQATLRHQQSQPAHRQGAARLLRGRAAHAQLRKTHGATCIRMVRHVFGLDHHDRAPPHSNMLPTEPAATRIHRAHRRTSSGRSTTSRRSATARSPSG